MKHTILFVAANPLGTDQRALDLECAAIDRELRMTAGRDEFEFLSRWAVSVDELMRHLNELSPTVLHVSGPAGSLPTGLPPAGSPLGSERLPSAGILLQDESRSQFVPDSALAKMIASASPSTHVVVLNVGDSVPVAERLRGVGCAVGMNGPLDTDAARSFAVAFYRALGHRRSIGNAVEQAIATLAGKQLVADPVCKVRNGLAADRVLLGQHDPPAPAVTPPDVPTAALTPIATEPRTAGAAHTADIGILTIRTDEFRAVLNSFPDRLGQFTGTRTGRMYSLRRADAGNGAHYTLAVLRQNEQGNGEAQNAARDLIEDLAPSLILVVGIAGGVPSADITLGDVVLATRIHDFTVEARTVDEAPTYSTAGGPVSKGLASLISNLAAQESELGDWTAGLPTLPPVSWTATDLSGPADWQEDVRAKLERHYGTGAPRAPIYVDGPIASSDRLVKDPEVLIPWLHTARKLLAVEMESGGVYRAAIERCPMLAVRGISDIVGLKRDERWTQFACESAAAFARALLRTTPVPPRSVQVGSVPGKTELARSETTPTATSDETLIALEGFIRREVARDIVGFGWNLPMIGREEAIGEMIGSFSSGSYRLVPVAGPGGVGKTRFLAEAAKRAIASGSVDAAYYVSTPEVRPDWNAELARLGRSLLIVDEVTNPVIVRRLVDKLSEPEHRCIVLIGIRSADLSVIEAVTRGTRNRFIAPLHHLQPLPAADTAALAKVALEYTAGKAPEQAIAWIARMSQGVPVWLMLTSKLICEGADLRDLPRDKWRLAERYIHDALPSELVDRDRLLRLLRWLALVHPYTREAQPLVDFMCDRTSLTEAQLDADVEQLAQRRLVTIFGMNKRRTEVRPAILRDSIIISCLSEADDSGTYVVSSEGRSLIEHLAKNHSSIDRVVLRRILSSLGRVRAIVNQRLPVLDVLGDAVERAVTLAKDAREQLSALSLAEMAAPAILSPLIYAARKVRTTIVPDYVKEEPWGADVTSRTEVIQPLPWSLFVACQYARTRDDCKQLLDELVALLPTEGFRDSRTPGARTDGKDAESLIPRLISEQFSPEFRRVLLDAARRYVKELRGPGAVSRMLAMTLTLPSLAVVVQYSWTIADKFVWGHYIIDPHTEVGQEICEIASQLIDGIKHSAVETNTITLWKILENYHQGLLRATTEGNPLWEEQLASCLQGCYDILTSRTISGRELFAARTIWYWHARHDRNTERREVASACEALYRSRPELAPYLEWLLDNMASKSHELAMASLADRLVHDSSIDLRAFFESALRLVDENGDELRARRVQDLATRLGEEPELPPHIQAFIASVPKERTPLFECAALIVAAQLGVIRRSGDLEKLRKMLNDWSAMLTPQLMIAEVYLHGSVLVQAHLTTVDWECLVSHLNLFSDDERWRLLGLAFAAQGDRTRDLVEAEVGACAAETLHEMFIWFWVGFHSRFIVIENAERSAFTIEQFEWFLGLLTRVPDLGSFSGSFVDDLETIGSHHPKHTASWLCNLILERRQCFVQAGSIDPNDFWPVSHDRLFLAFTAPAKVEDEPSINALVEYGYSHRVTPYGLAELLTELDQDGLVVPHLVIARLNSLEASSENLSDILIWAEYASMYIVGAPAWRRIAEAACKLAIALPRDDREQIYWTLFDHRGGVWSVRRGEVSDKWTSAVGDAEARLEQESEECLRPLFQWHLEKVRADLEREQRLAEEEAASFRGF